MFKPGFHFPGFICQTAGIEFRDHKVSGLVQLMDLSSLGKELESTLEGRESQLGLTGIYPGPSCLQMEDRRPRSAACVSGLGDVLIEFGRPPIVALAESKVCLLQDRWNVLG